MKAMNKASQIRTCVQTRNKRFKEIEEKYGIKRTCPFCSERCPYKKECQKETKAIRKAFREMPLEHVWFRSPMINYVCTGGSNKRYHSID